MPTHVADPRAGDRRAWPLQRRSRRLAIALAGVGLLAAAVLPSAAAAHDNDSHHERNLYHLHKLISDTGKGHTAVDPNLVNGWGLTAGPMTPWWVADNGTDKSSLYTGTGTVLGLVVDVPGGPTGTVFNTSTTDFAITGGGKTGVSRFLFATEGGQILGWNPAVPGITIPSTQAFVGATTPDAVYKGLAIGTSNGKTYLYAADFHHGRVDVFDGAFTLKTWANAFIDPNLPSNYAPFGIQNLNGMIFVTYAKQDAAKHDEIAGEGRGFVSVFATDGTFLGRVASRDELNAPWGLAWAPADFGRFSGDLLVGNFGDGRITAFAWTKNGWRERGQLKGSNHRTIKIDGLWGIGFGNGNASGPTNTLYVVAGPKNETHGFFGSITAN
jgi:uncharacterized protein (TIGR03118 family)